MPGFDLDTLPLPRGTRVVLRTDIQASDGYVHRRAAPAVVREVAYERYRLETPAGRLFEASRDQITVAQRNLLEDLGIAAWDHRKLRQEVIYSAVVGSQAWGLADEDSDEDVRGCFLLPFEDHASLFRAPVEIHDTNHEEALWEVQRFLEQALRGDANTLEALWSPLHRAVTPLGGDLLRTREAFVSMNVLGSFGRYAQAQFQKVERSLARGRATLALLDEIEAGRVFSQGSAITFLARYSGTEKSGREELRAILRSFLDRGMLESGGFDGFLEASAKNGVSSFRSVGVGLIEHRPKNAYNLLRLLHSCQHWLEYGEPLIRVDDPLRRRLWSIKRGQVPIETTMTWAKAQAVEVEEASRASSLPEKPNYKEADAFLRRCRRYAAKRAFGFEPGEAPRSTKNQGQRWFPAPLPSDVSLETLRRFFEREIREGWRPLWVSLTGAHAYGFPSVDSDLDLKGVHGVSSASLFGLHPETDGFTRLEVFEGREHDLSTVELAAAARLLAKGNGNILEQLLGPFPLLTTPEGEQLRDFAARNPSQASAGHYLGFGKNLRREYLREKAEGHRRAKRLLYLYRVALTGLHWLLEGVMEMDVRVLAERYGTPEVQELVELKRSLEKGELPEAMDDAPYLTSIEGLEARLETARDTCRLPASPDLKVLDRLLVDLRLSLGE